MWCWTRQGKSRKELYVLIFVFRAASDTRNMWIDGNDEASEGNFVFTDGSPSKRAE